MKGQVAVEYMIIVSVALTILLPLSLYINQSLMGYRDDTKISRAWTTVKKIGESVDWVYSQGPPAKLTIEIYIPDDVEEISFENKTVLFKIRTSSGISDAFYQTVPELKGSLSEKSGYYFVSLTAFPNYVNVSVVE
jgi:hypothetical protein